MERNMDESRKAFEQLVASTTNSDLHRGIMLERRESGVYSHLATENKWEAWQASRSAIEITVPANDFGNSSSPPGEGWSFSEASEVMEAMRNAGIKIKVRE